MATSWRLKSQEIVIDALEITGMVADGEDVQPSVFDMGMRALQNILKEFPLHGVSWSKVTTEPVLMVWDSLTPGKISVPADYYGLPLVAYTQNGVKVPVEVVNRFDFEAIPTPAQTAEYPQKIYIDPLNKGYLWPIPTANPQLYITYQAIEVDALSSTIPDIVQSWGAGMALWVAYEILPKTALTPPERAEIERRFMMRRRLMLASLAENAPLVLSVIE